MQFVIDELILWPRDVNLKPEALSFTCDKINVVHGRSGTGKSSLIAIIDYCLGASRCAIPVGKIREKVSWFGLVVNIRGQRVLLARRSPTMPPAGKEFLFEPAVQDVPKRITPNCSASEFKERLNAVANLTNLPLSTDEVTRQHEGRPSYRDLASFNFLPQHIVANPNTLFYRADSYDHREHLKRVMPLALGIIDSTYAANERERSQLLRELERVQREADSYRKALEPLTADVRRLWLQAVELGLCSGGPPSIEECMSTFTKLQAALESGALLGQLRPLDYQTTNEQFHAAVADEERLQRGVDDARRRVRGLQQLATRGTQFRKAVMSERSRAVNLDWLKEAVAPEGQCVACGAPAAHLPQVLSRLEDEVNRTEVLTKALLDEPIVDKEIETSRTMLQTLAGDLHGARLRRIQLEKVDQAARSSTSRLFLLLGEIRATLAAFAKVNSHSHLEKKRTEIEARLNELDKYFAVSDRAERERQVDRTIAASIATYARDFKLEDRGPVSLDKNELTLVFKRPRERPEYLWELGSGANWMGYHLSCFLALHDFLVRTKEGELPVFSFLVIDQPSQVYFPSAASGANDLDLPPEQLSQVLVQRNPDVVATRRIFEMLEQARAAAAGRYQIIVLEHADDTIWGSLPNVPNEVVNWKAPEAGLIPASW